MSRTTYICGICNTKPDQLSHHTAHLNTTGHKDQKIICEHNLRKYSLGFGDMFGKYKKIMMETEYFAERSNSPDGEFPTFSGWVCKKNTDIVKRYHLNELDEKRSMCLVDLYKTETGKVPDFNDQTDKLLFFDWKLNRLIKECETIVKTTRQKTFKYCDPEIITRIDNDEIGLDELIRGFVDTFCSGCDKCDDRGSKRDFCEINETKLRYILYKMFKDKIAYKRLDVTTIIMGETEVRKQMMWVSKNDNHIESKMDVHRSVNTELAKYEDVIKLVSKNIRMSRMELILRDLFRE